MRGLGSWDILRGLCSGFYCKGACSLHRARRKGRKVMQGSVLQDTAEGHSPTTRPKPAKTPKKPISFVYSLPFFVSRGSKPSGFSIQNRSTVFGFASDLGDNVDFVARQCSSGD